MGRWVDESVGRWVGGWEQLKVGKDDNHHEEITSMSILDCIQSTCM